MDYTLVNNKPRGSLIEIHIADIHFGAMEPETEYNILKEQFLIPISLLPKIDIISIDGDLFDKKFMANSEPIKYAILFVGELVQICKQKNATLVLVKGTDSHAANQQRLFYHYLSDPEIDIRIVETIKFEYIKGAKILCIPELYGIDESVYRHFFFESGWYDEAFIHCTCQGAVYGDNVGQGRLLTKEDFIYCRGMAISGHVHKPGCFFGWYYYTGCPIRYKFGEEEAKGFLIVVHDLDTHVHYVEFEEITSFRYNTIQLTRKELSEDPKRIIDYINNLKQNEGIDFLKVRFVDPVPGYNQTIINNYYRTNPNFVMEFLDATERAQIEQEQIMKNNLEYSYLTDNNLSEYEKFVMYVNNSEGGEFITVDKLMEILKEIV